MKYFYVHLLICLPKILAQRKKRTHLSGYSGQQCSSPKQGKNKLQPIKARTRNSSTVENVQKWTRYCLFFPRVQATSMTQRRVENTRVHFWTFSPVSVKDIFAMNCNYFYFLINKNLFSKKKRLALQNV